MGRMGLRTVRTLGEEKGQKEQELEEQKSENHSTQCEEKKGNHPVAEVR